MGFNILFTLLALYFVALISWIIFSLLRDSAPRMLAADQNKLRGTGRTFFEAQEKSSYTIIHSVEDGIERIVYSPKVRQHETPILMAHGMWHGAWCWQPWQEILAENGWQSVAFSLPGHGKSPLQRPLRQCTLGYYLAFVRDEIQRLPVQPILMGHSMGGALTQWVLRHISSSALPAAVLVAPWVSHSALSDPQPVISLLKYDLPGVLMMFYQLNANSWVRTPAKAAEKLLSPESIVTPEELHRQLNGESALVIYQHNPPFWQPAENVQTPVLVVAGERDAVVSVEKLRQTASHYRGEFLLIPGAAHNLMMEKSYRETAESIHKWLFQQNIA
jgi:pimeloyl-ACP methyl ester carboxylesterase